MKPFPYREQAWLTFLPTLRSLTRTQLEFKPDWTPSSIGEIIRHIVSTESGWIEKTLYGSPKDEGEGVDIGDSSSLISYRDRVRSVTNARIDGADLDAPFAMPEFPDGWRPLEEANVRWIFEHVFGHENYHLGQCVMLLRMQGIEYPLF